jgi:Domain of unknown function (DUF4440)
MWGAIEQGKSAAISATVQPAVRWGGFLTIVAGVLIAAFAFPKAQPKAQPVAADEAPILAADAALGEAMRAGDKALARRVLALQFTLVDADGKIHPRKEFLADLKRLAPAPASDVKIRSLGLVATVTGRHKSAHDADVFFIDVWVKQKGAWRALLMQDVPTAPDDAPAATAAPGPAAEPPPYECDNPCKTIPYRVRSAAEQDVVSTFQTIMKAIVAHDANEWAKHVADEFVTYASGRAPIAKSARIATIERQKESNATVRVGEVQAMRLAVYGDGAVMTATGVDEARPPYRAARVFMKRDGQWLMAISAHTDVK